MSQAGGRAEFKCFKKSSEVMQSWSQSTQSRSQSTARKELHDTRTTHGRDESAGQAVAGKFTVLLPWITRQ